MDLTYAVFVTNFMLVTMGLLLLHVWKTYSEMEEPNVQSLVDSMPGFFDYDAPNNGLSQLWFVLKVQALLVLIYKVIKHGPLNTFVWILSAFIDPLYNVVLKLRLLVILKTTGAEDKVDSNEARRAVEDGSLWAEFCDGLKAAGEVVLNESRYPQVTLLDKVEGYRYLTRLIRGGLSGMVENTDVYFPRMLAIPDQVKIGCDNPLNWYGSCVVRGDLTYRIWGNRGSVHYLSIGALQGAFPGAKANVAQNVTADTDATDLTESSQYGIDNTQIVTDDNGDFELILCAKRPPGCTNWLRIDRDTTRLCVRQTFLDASSETRANLQVECLEARGRTRPPLTAAELVKQLRAVHLFVHGVASQFQTRTHQFAEESRNQLTWFDSMNSKAGWADPNIKFHHGYWQLEPDEALLIFPQPPPSLDWKYGYWNFQLNNWWMESLDSVGGHRITVNSLEAVALPSGRCVIVVAHKDPELPNINWIDTCGHLHGDFGLRYVRCDVDDAKAHRPICQVVKIADLEMELSAGNF